MKIKGNENERAVLQEIGTRIKQQRISQDITQAALADKCGISHATVVRIENGEDSKFSNYIKILQAMKLAENMDVLVPEPQPDFKALFEDKTVKKRATTKSNRNGSAWVWGEDKMQSKVKTTGNMFSWNETIQKLVDEESE